MIRLTENQIKEIADNLDTGMNCYINKITGEIVTVLDFDSWPGGDTELWEDVLTELQENWDKYVQIERMESRESFEIMEDFTGTVDDKDLQNRLITALNKRHPFQNFKWQIDNSGPYRQKWFDFKEQRLIDWVKNNLDHLEIEYDL
ncbi:MAG TPA: UPF0158 family protein [Bacteroidales bacterium]|nr:UPF0158 family protein [Bacteroidales bacterium]